MVVTNFIGRARCEECGASIIPTTPAGDARQLTDWRPHDEHLCKQPPWNKCPFFVEALTHFLMQ